MVSLSNHMRLYLFPLILLAALAAAILVPRLSAPVSASPRLLLSGASPVTPAGDKICYSVFPLNSGKNSPYGIIQGPDGNLWFFERLYYASGYAIARITPDGLITDFPIPGYPQRMASGPDGNLWYTSGDGAIGRMTLTGTVTTFTLPVSNTSPFGITTGPDGNLWITEPSANQILRMTPSGTVTGQFGVSGYPGMIIVGPDNALWFTFTQNGKIGRISLSGTVTEFPLPLYPADVTLGPDGNIWFTEFDYSSSKYGKITPSGTITEFNGTGRAGVISSRIITGADGNLWATNIFWGKYRYTLSITRITPTGSQTEFDAGVALSPPSGDIATGSDGKLWVTLYSIVTFDPRILYCLHFLPFVAK